MVASPDLCPAQFSSAALTDDAGPFQYASRSWILGRVSFSARLILSSAAANRADPDELPLNKAFI